MKAIKWFSGFFEDQKGSASSKRAVMYIFTFFFFLQMKASLTGGIVNETILYSTVGIVLVGLGMITSEFLKDFIPSTKDEVKK